MILTMHAPVFICPLVFTSRVPSAPPRVVVGVLPVTSDGGQACSDFLSKKFHLELAKHAKLQSDPKAALLEVWDSMDGLFYESCVQVLASSIHVSYFGYRLVHACPTVYVFTCFMCG